MILREYTDKKFNAKYDCDIDFDSPLDVIQDELDELFNTSTSYISYNKSDVINNSDEKELGGSIVIVEITTQKKTGVYFGILANVL